MIKFIVIEIKGEETKLSPDEAKKLYLDLVKIYGNTGYPLPIQPTKCYPFDTTIGFPITWDNGGHTYNIPINTA